MPEQMVDLRCPVTPRRMFARLIAGEASILPDNVIEIACLDCRNAARRMGDPSVSLVLHRYNLLGVCIETVMERET